jgi:hypothetical protein
LDSLELRTARADNQENGKHHQEVYACAIKAEEGSHKRAKGFSRQKAIEGAYGGTGERSDGATEDCQES